MPPYKQLTELPCNATLFELYIDSTDVTGRQLCLKRLRRKSKAALLQILMVEFNCSYIS